MRDARELIAQMTLEEKAALCSGKNFWHTKPVERLSLPSVMVTDGPHGLRKQEGKTDHIGIAESVKSTCFPAACATACTFDTALLREMGRALGAECQQEEVAVLLGPGVNIKRSPLSGRNFEYFSEDPLLGGELATAFIEGVQEMGVGTSLKHYAVNDQETRRMTIDAVTDMRALREIYLKSFEIPVRKAKPWTVMCAYNRINGTYASDNTWLLTDILRKEWGFEGLVVTDWGAMNDRVQSVLAGCDLEMPGSAGAAVNDAKIVEAVRDGRLKESDVDALALRVVEMVLKAQAAQKKQFRYDTDKHHQLARKIAADSCVLLKNEHNLLPLKTGTKIAIIGEMAKVPRYQGAGSSRINPSRMDSAFDELVKLGISASYAQGYDGIDAAVALAREARIAVVFAGLPDEYESEGFDRKDMEMPENHVKLIREVAKANPNTIVVLQLGAPVRTDWAADVKGLVVSYLGGQAGGGGIADVLTGAVCPGGKLPETWPLTVEDTPCYHAFPGGKKTVEYRESIFVGYRYYETADKPVAWPFGFGLSYTDFKYDNLSIKNDEISFEVTNTGEVSGAETVQIYLGLPQSAVFRPKKWLAAFEKVRLTPGETQTVRIKLGADAFQYFNTAANGWRTEGGEYTVYVGASVKDIRLTGQITVMGDGDEKLLSAQQSLVYFNVKNNSFPQADFAAIYGKPLPPTDGQPDEPYTINSTVRDIRHTFIGRIIVKAAYQQVSKSMGITGAELEQKVESTVLDMPLRAMGMMNSDAMPPDFAELLIATLNGNFFSRAAATIKFARVMMKLR